MFFSIFQYFIDAVLPEVTHCLGNFSSRGENTFIAQAALRTLKHIPHDPEFDNIPEPTVRGIVEPAIATIEGFAAQWKTSIEAMRKTLLWFQRDLQQKSLTEYCQFINAAFPDFLRIIIQSALKQLHAAKIGKNIPDLIIPILPLDTFSLEADLDKAVYTEDDIRIYVRSIVETPNWMACVKELRLQGIGKIESSVLLRFRETGGVFLEMMKCAAK